jgi:cellulose synthase/poly-beta-1,6-N-acetylglucosamine synthase-like glycosyltransferase
VIEGQVARWTGPDATVLLPVDNDRDAARLRLVAACRSAHGPSVGVRVTIGSAPVATLDLDAQMREHFIDVPGEVVAREAVDIINNAGTNLSELGEASDRGIFEPDRGQYDREEDVDAICGAAVLLRRSALDDVGLFDGDFFMYFEDTDLSWRLRSRGYRLRYQPRSVIRHHHAAASVEWSPLFVFHTVRNRALMVVKNGVSRAIIHLAREETRCIIGHLRVVLVHRGTGEARTALRMLMTRLHAFLSFVWHLPRALGKRRSLRAT